MVTRDFMVPLLSRVYPGKVPDVSLFPRLAEELIARYRQLSGDSGDATLVFDKGNISDDGMEALAVRGVRFVAALSANRSKELLSTPPERLEPVSGLPGTSAFSTMTEIRQV